MPVILSSVETADERLLQKVYQQKHHQDLADARVTIALAFAEDEEGGHAVYLNNYPCAAVVKITPYRQRFHGVKDAEILIDKKTWEDLDAGRREALLDHELTHLLLQRDDKQLIKRDHAGRPKLKMKNHDWQLGGFVSVAERHGDKALEVLALRAVSEKWGQLIFSFAEPAGAAAT